MQVLRDVPLPATELDVCLAVQQWALSYYGDDLDDHTPDMPTEELIIPNEEDRAALDHIDLTCIKSADIKLVRAAIVFAVGVSPMPPTKSVNQPCLLSISILFHWAFSRAHILARPV